ncbi:PAS domain-containing protein [Myxococcaceae bacterium JPH2]|nr:PAS domain-containing protein [Myxococcaceae bacterium JPH2]
MLEPVLGDEGQVLDLRWTSLSPSAEVLVEALDLGRDVSGWVREGIPLVDVAACARVVRTGVPHVAPWRCPLGATEGDSQVVVVRHEQGLALWLVSQEGPRQGAPAPRESLEVALAARREAEEARALAHSLQAREELLRLALETARMVAWEWTEARRSVTWSADAEAFFGQSPGTLSTTLAGFLPCILPDDRPRVSRAIEQGLVADGPYTFKFRCRWPDGSLHCYEAVGQTFHGNERTHRMLGVVVDCTEREQATAALREAEERYRLAARATHDVLWDWHFSTTGRVKWDPGTGDAFGYGDLLEWHDLDWWGERVHPEDRGPVVQRLKHFVDSDEDAWQAEYRFLRGDGSWAHVLDRGVLARDDQGRPVRMIGSMMDITERKRALERLAEEAEFRERFIGILGHDLRNPLNAISLSARALRRRASLSPAQQQLAQRIESSAGRMGNMISDILDLTRARLSGGIPLNLGPVDLGSVCRQVVEELCAAHPERLIALDVDGRAEGVWDAERLAQVLSNLVGNALEHGASDSPVLLHCSARGDEQVLEVHNPGTPIPSHLLDSIFDPFRQAGLGRGRRRAGLGLGLFIVKEIVLAHGGTVCVSSSDHEGTTFTVTLPRDARPAARGAGTQGEARSA